MASAVQERIYKLTVDASAAVAKLDQIAKSTGAVEQKMSKMGSTINTAFSGLASAATIGVALKTAFDFADQVIDMADAFGASAESILKLQGAFQSFGGKAESVTNVLTKVAQTTNDAIAGNDAARKSFLDLGISIESLVGKDADQVFLTLSAAIAKIPDPLKRAAVSADLFGKGIKGIDLAAMSKDMGDTAEKAGRLDTQLRAAAAGQDFLEKSWRFAKTTLAGLVGEVALFLSLVETKAPESVTRVIAANGKWVASNDALKQSFETIAEAQAKYNEIAKKAEGNIKIAPSESAIKAAAAATKAAADEQAKWNAVIVKSVEDQIAWEQKLKDSLNPMNEIDRELARLQIAIDNQRISWDQYADGMFKITDKVDGLKAVKEPLDEIGVAIGVSLQQGVSSLIDSFDQAGASFGKMAADFLKNIAKMIAQMYILKAIGSTSWGQSLGIGVKQANGGVWDHGVQKFAMGGIVNSPTAFGMAGGRMGIMGEAGAEVIAPLRRNSKGQMGVGASPVNVVINNNAGVEVSQSSSTGADGQTTINILVEKRIKDLLANGGLDKSFRSSFGLTRQAA
jgi:hypothetical protein